MWILLASFLALPNYTFPNAIVQAICLLIWSYTGHVFAHMVSTSWPFNVLNPHVYIHHNKQILLERNIELIIEAVVNFFGFFIIIIAQWLIGVNLFSTTMILGSAFLYITIHILDYSVYGNNDHKIHHEKTFCNYDPEFFDVLFNTRCDSEKPYKNMIGEIPHAVIASGFAYLLKLVFQLD